MKTNKLRSKPTSIAKTRWASYAAAGAATAFIVSNSVEGAIHYSGHLNKLFPPNKDTARKIHLNQPGNFLFFERIAAAGQDVFAAYGIVSAGFRGFTVSSGGFVSKLSFGEEISVGYFVRSGAGLGTMAHAFSQGTQWGDRGTGYVGFRFNNGAGIQYGWARVRMSGQPENAFRVVDCAYADPGEPIKAGQTSSDEQVPDQGSLGGLALGAAGLLAWRKSRTRTAVRNPGSTEY